MTPIPTWLERYQADPYRYTAPYQAMADEILELRKWLFYYQTIAENAHIPVESFEKAVNHFGTKV